jgi:AbrB family looped-hinge helix DNA binding protein
MPAVRVKLNEGGRIVIPAEYRRELGLEEGDMLIVERDGDGLHIRSALAALERAQALFLAHVPPGTGSLADELIAERRAENATDEADAQADLDRTFRNGR